MTHDCAVSELTDYGDHVLVWASALGNSACSDGNIVLARDPRGEVDVVCGQVHDYADVTDPVRERALPPCDDLEYVAEFAELESLLKVLQCGVESLDVSDAGD
jgi:hypothetical protein